MLPVEFRRDDLHHRFCELTKARIAWNRLHVVDAYPENIYQLAYVLGVNDVAGLDVNSVELLLNYFGLLEIGLETGYLTAADGDEFWIEIRRVIDRSDIRAIYEL